MATRRRVRKGSRKVGTYQKKMKACLIRARSQPGKQTVKFARCARESSR